MALTDPTQTPPQVTKYDPFAGSAERDAVAKRLFGTATAPVFGYTPPGANAAQNAAMGTTGQLLGEARPLYSTGVNTLQRTAAGDYLDPTKTDVYQGLETRMRDVAKDLFGDLSGAVAGRAAGRGTFFSSARQNQQNEQARRVTSQTEADLAGRAFGQYGQERQLQQQAAGVGANLAPALASQQFSQGTTVRGQDLQEQELALRSFLANQGVNQTEIDQMMRFLQLTRPDLLGPLVGPSPISQTTDILNTGANIARAGADIAKLFA